MTAEQSLVGAMGCASWRSHCHLREHAGLAPVAHVIRGRASLEIERADAANLNEVGITDTVLAAIWRFGPYAAAYAVSSHAEARHLGADIAIVRLSARRILLYQAKLARLNDGVFRLKSSVTKEQLALLRRRRRIDLHGIRFQVTGRLALYQQDLTPYLERCPSPFVPSLWLRAWLSGPGPFPADLGGDWRPEPNIGREYYEVMLADRGCSPSGVLAALVPDGSDRVTTVAVPGTWPWEFDAHQWLRQANPDDGSGRQSGADLGFGGAAPEFEEYLQTIADEQQPRSGPGFAVGWASALADRLRLPASIRLYVIILP